LPPPWSQDHRWEHRTSALACSMTVLQNAVPVAFFCLRAKPTPKYATPCLPPECKICQTSKSQNFGLICKKGWWSQSGIAIRTECASESDRAKDPLGSHSCGCKNYRRVARRRTHLWTQWDSYLALRRKQTESANSMITFLVEVFNGTVDRARVNSRLLITITDLLCELVSVITTI
jgi:hypothetical protein